MMILKMARSCRRNSLFTATFFATWLADFPAADAAAGCIVREMPATDDAVAADGAEAKAPCCCDALLPPSLLSEMKSFLCCAYVDSFTGRMMTFAILPELPVGTSSSLDPSGRMRYSSRWAASTCGVVSGVWLTLFERREAEEDEVALEVLVSLWLSTI